MFIMLLSFIFKFDCDSKHSAASRKSIKYSPILLRWWLIFFPPFVRLDSLDYYFAAGNTHPPFHPLPRWRRSQARSRPQRRRRQVVLDQGGVFRRWVSAFLFRNCLRHQRGHHEVGPGSCQVRSVIWVMTCVRLGITNIVGKRPFSVLSLTQARTS